MKSIGPSTCTNSHQPDRANFARELCGWFSHHQRDLPWRREPNARDPYRVLVSEVMLQQTTVAAVVPFYLRFIERFPTLQVLADADIDDVLPLWAGLGYYSRARNLHACAQKIVRDHAGIFPRELAQVLALPGVGRYTAGAVTSIAWGQPSPIVDANVARVLARVCAIEGDIKAPATLNQLWEESQKRVESAANAGCKPSDFNPAMMELGALICRPREPLCEQCPVSSHCLARMQNRQHELPHLRPKAQPTALNDACALAVRDSNGEEQVLVRQRSHDAGTWWRGMWELPRTTRRGNESAREALVRLLRDELQLPAQVLEAPPIARLKHGITVYQVTLECFSVQIGEFAPREDVRWIGWNDAFALAISSPMKKMMQMVRETRMAGQKSLFD